MRTSVKCIVLLCLLCAVLLMFACCGRKSDNTSQTGNGSTNAGVTDDGDLSAELEIDVWQDDEATTPSTPGETDAEEEADSEGTSSGETKPKETTPKETTPKETTPEETTPEETTPKETTPSQTTPNGPIELPVIPG